VVRQEDFLDRSKALEAVSCRSRRRLIPGDAR
jgi:hypothetical protein